jgi:hypothetical protein
LISAAFNFLDHNTDTQAYFGKRRKEVWADRGRERRENEETERGRKYAHHD